MANEQSYNEKDDAQSKHLSSSEMTNVELDTTKQHLQSVINNNSSEKNLKDHKKNISQIPIDQNDKNNSAQSDNTASAKPSIKPDSKSHEHINEDDDNRQRSLSSSSSSSSTSSDNQISDIPYEILQNDDDDDDLPEHPKDTHST